MQPLDVAVNGPFKQKKSVAQNDWLLEHPGRTITIHDLTTIVTPAYNASHTPNNIISGFSKPGICPFNRNAFTDDDFQCAEVTNRPQPDMSTEIEGSVAANGIPGIIQPTVSSLRGSHNNMPQTTPGLEETDQRGSPSICDQFPMAANALLEIPDINQPTEVSQRSHTPQTMSLGPEETDQRGSSSICDQSECSINDINVS